MEKDIKKFNINGYILKNSYHKSFVFNDSGSILLYPNDTNGFFVTNKLDSAQKGMRWGRISINAQFLEDCEFYIYAMASDEVSFKYENKLITYDQFFNSKDISVEQKVFILSSLQSKVVKNLKDILLNGLEGRYLWLAMEVKYVSNKSLCIENISVYFPGDSLIKYFPEIYRKNKDNFFERYLSIFSSLNKDYQRNVDKVCRILDIDEMSDKVIPLVSKWLGLDFEGNFLTNQQLKTLIKHARWLNQYKGTVEVISKVIEIFIGLKPIIVEQIKIKKYTSVENFNLYQMLYGIDPYGFLVMLNLDLDEKVFYQLKSLINVFKPARTKATIIFLTQECQVDKHCYVDINAKVSHDLEGTLDQNRYLDRNVIVAK